MPHNNYRFQLKDFHAIGNADIALNGLTVIAGKNGCGKSTIARWLYAFVNYSNDFNRLVDNEFIGTLNRELRVMSRILRDMSIRNNSVARIFRSIPLIQVGQEEVDYYELLKSFHGKLNLFSDEIEKFIAETDDENSVIWLQRALVVNSTSEKSLSFIENFQSETLRRVKKAIQRAQKRKQERSMTDLMMVIRRELEIAEESPDYIQLEENGMNLVAKWRFIPPFGLKQAVYVDTPMAISNRNSSDNNIWGNLMHELTTSLHEMPDSARRLANYIRMVIGGDIVVQDDEFNDDVELRFVRKADNLNIAIDDAATGLKSFAYMLRLLENGYLTENTLLLIDEPEAHLHPQWIVEFARVLVLLQKEVGTKILLASHNPDMIAALKAIAESVGISDSTCFYQAEVNDESSCYDYKNLGNDIEEIFKSFNIAIARIDEYGTGM